MSDTEIVVSLMFAGCIVALIGAAYYWIRYRNVGETVMFTLAGMNCVWLGIELMIDWKVHYALGLGFLIVMALLFARYLKRVKQKTVLNKKET
jgi:hypothetical protein